MSHLLENRSQPTWPAGMLSGHGSGITPVGFPACVELFRQAGGELPDLIAAALPAHTRVLKWLGSRPATDARWSYITCPDNVVDVLEWVRPCSLGKTDADRLRVLLTQPAAEGGVSFLGLAPPGGEWLYWVHCDPSGPELVASFFGKTDDCDQLRRGGHGQEETGEVQTGEETPEAE